MDIITETLDLDISGFDGKLGHLIDGYEKLEQTARKASGSNPFKKQAEDLQKVNAQLRSGNELFKKMGDNPKVVKGEIDRLTQQVIKLVTSQEKAAKAGQWKQQQEDIKKTRAELDALQKKYDQLAESQKKAGGGGTNNAKSPGVLGLVGNKFLGGAGSLLGSLGLGLGAAEIISGIVSVRAEYQRLGKQLEISLGSKSAGAAAQRLITDFANKTPHDIAGVTTAFNRLVDVGIVPTEKHLFQLSDIAVSKGKTINDYVEAIADAQTGEFERLKEFGITATKNGDKIIFNFKGQQTEVKNTAAAIDDYLISLGSVAGVAGQTEEAGKNLEGRWSTLKDTFAGIGNDIGLILQPAMEKLLDVTQSLADNTSLYIKSLKQIGESGGVLSVLQALLNPSGIAAQVGTAQAEANKANAGKPKEEDPLEKKRKELAAQQKANEAQRKALADRQAAEKAAKAQAEKQKQIDLDILREAQKQIEERKKLADELKTVQENYDKLRLEQLDKGSAEYIELKRKLDLAEIEQERQKLIELGKLATGTPVYNRKTKRVEIQKNDGYALPASTEQIFSDRAAAVESGAQVDAFTAAEARGRETFERQQYLEKSTRTRLQNELELELRQKLLDTDSELIRKAGESEIDYEKRKNEALLKLRLDYYTKLLELAEKDPSQKEQILGLKETIAGLKKDIADSAAKGKSGPLDLWDLLGIQFDKDPKKNDQIKTVVSDTVRTIIDGANQILQSQISNDQAHIDSYDRQIQAKQNEINVELELSRQGLANNLQVKRAEEQQLQNERKKAVEAKRRDQAIQIGLNTILQESEMALAVAKLLSNSATLGPFGIIAAGVSIAAMLALFATSIGQIANLPKYHDGDEVTLDTARKRAASGDKRADEVDVRLQVGEGVTRKASYQPNKKLLSRINKLGRGIESRDLADLLDGTGVELPDAVREQDIVLINQYQGARAHQPDTELHRRVDGLASRLDTLIDETRRSGKTSREILPDGRIREVDASGNVRVYRVS